MTLKFQSVLCSAEDRFSTEEASSCMTAAFKTSSAYCRAAKFHTFTVRHVMQPVHSHLIPDNPTDIHFAFHDSITHIA